MSNDKEDNNTSRRIRKGYKERLNLLMLMRPLRTKTKVLADEFVTENLNKLIIKIRKLKLIKHNLTILYNNNFI
jgi:hypothetical protein